MCVTQQLTINNSSQQQQQPQPQTTSKMSLPDAFTRALFPTPKRTKLHVEPRLLGSLSRNDWQMLLRTLEGKAVQEFVLVTDEYSYDTDDEEEWNQTEVVHRVRTLLDICPNVTRVSLPCSYAPLVLDAVQHSQLRDLEIDAIPLPLAQEEEGVVATRSIADMIISHCFSGAGGANHYHHLERIYMRGVEGGDEYANLSAESLLMCFESPSLKKLELKAMEVLPSAAVTPRRLGEALRANTSLELLRTRCGSVPEAILLEIGRALWDENRTLYYVDIGSLEGVTDAVAQTFTTVMACNSVFRSLECNLNSISNFKFMSLKNMFCMDISDNLLGDEGALLIANCLPGASIERLNFADNGITRVGASAIAWGMGQCKYLRICNICDNPVMQETDTATIQSPLAQAILAKVQTSPAYSHGFLGMLCAAFKDHQSMAHLNLASTGLADKDGPLLALLLRVSCVRELYLGRNSLGDETCGHLYSVLGDDQCDLTSLSIQLNSFTAMGFYTFWHGILRTNSKLQNVQIGLRTYSIYGRPRGQRDVDIALRLNKAGRVHLIRDQRATLNEWLECLFAVADDVDCSYALLRENPSLCTAAGVAK